MKHLHFRSFDHDARPAGGKQGMCLKGGKGLCTGVSRSHSVRTRFGGEKITVTEGRPGGGRPGGSMPLFERRCANEVLWSAVLLVVGGRDPCSNRGY